MSKCPRCTRVVYFAEESRAVGKIWHKFCLTCATCKKRVDSTTVRDHDSEIYCKSCYARHFGPKGYGFAGGASGLSMESTRPHEFPERADRPIKAHIPAMNGEPASSVPSMNGDTAAKGHSAPTNGEPGSGIRPAPSQNICPVCSKVVYMAERITGPGSQDYHKLCFKCSLCKKILDSTTLTERQCQIYCKACYNKNFGPKGFGFGQALTRT